MDISFGAQILMVLNVKKRGLLSNHVSVNGC